MHLSACRINICRASTDELCRVTARLSFSLSFFLSFSTHWRVSSFNTAHTEDATAREMLQEHVQRATPSTVAGSIKLAFYVKWRLSVKVKLNIN